MPDHTSNGMQCNEFELLLTDAIDGVLTGARLDRFQSHGASCATCGPLLAEAEAGRNWLKGLTEVEPPASLVNNILASTTGVDTQRLRDSRARSASRAFRGWSTCRLRSSSQSGPWFASRDSPCHSAWLSSRCR